MTALRDCHDGNRTDDMKALEVSCGMGARVNDEGSEGLRIDVEAGSNGEVVEGVSSALRFVDMLSSMLARDRRRKSRTTLVLKQNCGVSCEGVAVGLDIISGLGFGVGSGEGQEETGEDGTSGCRAAAVSVWEGEVSGGVVVGGDVQNHASLSDLDG